MSQVAYLGHPPQLVPEDDCPHAAPTDDVLWGDTFWLDCVDERAGVAGLCHFSLTNGGFARFHVQFWIDGVKQCFGRRAPFELEPGIRKWSDGALTYEVLEPFERLRLTFDSPKFGFDLEYTGRFPAYEYEDCAHGNPLKLLGKISAGYGGHYQQPMHCRGTFEIRQGPAAGEVRQIDTEAIRDHTWSDRFASETPWEVTGPPVPTHFWTAIELPERHIHAIGFFDLPALGIEPEFKPVGGFESSARGNRVVLDAAPIPGYVPGSGERMRTEHPTGYRIEIDGGEIVTARVTKVHGVAHLWMRGDNDLENRLDCIEQLVEFEIEETGERGHGMLEHGIMPPEVRWLT